MRAWSTAPRLGQGDQRGRDGAAQQGFAGLPLRGRVESFEELHFAAGEVQFLETLDPATQWEARKALLRGAVPPSLVALS